MWTEPSGSGPARRRGWRALTAGIAEADSWAADAHKWLQVPYDCGLAVVRDAGALSRAMSITASYLPKGENRAPEAFSPEMSRRARGFAVWAVLKALGRAGRRRDGGAALRGGAA